MPEADVASARASSSLRAPWFEVSCCPTNVTRTIASLGACLATVDDGGVQVHQYATATVSTRIGDGHDVVLRIETDYPADGHIRVTVVEGPRTPWTLSLRVPAWAHEAVLAAGGEHRDVEPGYATTTRAFKPGEVVELDLPVAARWTWPDARVDAVRGQVAVECGPLVLCLESTDLGASVNAAVVRTDVPPVEHAGVVQVAVSMLDARRRGHAVALRRARCARRACRRPWDGRPRTRQPDPLPAVGRPRAVDHARVDADGRLTAAAWGSGWRQLGTERGCAQSQPSRARTAATPGWGKSGQPGARTSSTHASSARAQSSGGRVSATSIRAAMAG